MTIRTLFIITLVLFGLLLLFISASVIITSQQVAELGAQEAIAHDLERGASDLGYLSNDYLLYHESQQRTRWESRFSSFSDDLSKLNTTNPEQQTLVNNIKSNQQRLRSVFTEVVATLEGASQTQNTPADPALIQVSWSRMQVQSQGILFDASRLSQMLDDQGNQWQQTNLVLILALMGVFSAYFLTNYVLVYRRILSAIADLQAGTTIIGSGNLDHLITNERTDEIGELSRAFNRMTANLKNVTASKAELEREVEERKRAEQALRESEQRFKAIASSTPDHLLVQDRDLRYSMVLNPQLGLTEPDMIGKTDYDFLSREDADHLTQVKRQVLETGMPVHLETSLVSSTGEEQFFDGSYVPKFNAHGEVDGLIGYFRNVTQRKKREEELARLNRTLRAHSHSDQALMRATNEAEYMNEVCRIIVEDCGHAMVWIGFAEDDEAKSVRPVAYAGFEEGYLETLDITWADTERGRGPTGTAIRTGHPRFCRNMTTDPKFAPWRVQALRRGYASSLVLPLSNNGHVFGALTIYFREPDPFTEDEVTLLASLADDLAYGIGTLRLREAHAQAEAALRQSEERYRSLFESIGEGFALHEIICDEQGTPVDYRFLDINPAFERLTGLKREDVIGKTMRAVLPGNDDDWVKIYGRVALTGEPVHFENYSSALNQHYEVFAYSPAPRQFAVLFLNITERKQAEEHIKNLNRELEQQAGELQQMNVQLEETLAEEQVAREEAQVGRNILESLMQHAPEVLIIADAPDVDIHMISGYGQQVIGRPLDELLGVPGRAHPMRQQLFQLDGMTPIAFEENPLVRAIQRGEVVLNCEMVLRRTDGGELTILCSAGPIRAPDGKITGGIASWRDIPARKQIERSWQEAMREVEKLNRDLEQRAVELQIANQELESFSYSISHDLRTPLASINSFAALVLQDYGHELAPEPLRFIKLIRDHSTQMAQLVEALLRFSRFIRQPLRKQPVDLQELVRQALEDLSAQQQGRKVEIILGDLPPCEADPLLLKQVFVNLLSNALKFTRQREVTRIEIGAESTREGETLYFIRDNGVGFDNEQAEKLFGVFQRLHSEEEYEGTGVGLAIVERIIRRHGGRVCAEGEVGRGATFYFTLDCSQHDRRPDTP